MCRVRSETADALEVGPLVKWACYPELKLVIDLQTGISKMYDVESVARLGTVE